MSSSDILKHTATFRIRGDAVGLGTAPQVGRSRVRFPMVSLEFFIYLIPPAAKVAGSIPDGVTGIFHWLNPSGRTMALGSTKPLPQMSTRDIPRGEGGEVKAVAA
jgi:hypothetical protein